ncbi:MAG: hypothetical protein ISR65_05910 [Bacteriovoracaceae bacterium]|nr:hypothetical protein [Bacteriovoracaceae bacterium]
MAIQKHNVLKTFTRTSDGQSLVEYIMLLAMLGVISLAVIKSAPFQKFMGEDGELFAKYRAFMEYSYRHGLGGSGPSNINLNTGKHDTFMKNNQTRFFGNDEAYP